MKQNEVDEVKANLGIYLLKLRNSKKVTRKQVTEATGLTAPTIINMEFGRGCTLDSLVIYRNYLRSLPNT